jgi:hypothetical protein
MLMGCCSGYVQANFQGVHVGYWIMLVFPIKIDMIQVFKEIIKRNSCFE